MSGVKSKAHFSDIKLEETRFHPGRADSDQSVLTASHNLNAVAAEDMVVIDTATAVIASLTDNAEILFLDELAEIREQANQIITRADTVGSPYLVQAARGLWDITNSMILTNRRDGAPVQTYVRALKLFSPAAMPSQAETEQALSELAAVKAAYHLQT